MGNEAQKERAAEGLRLLLITDGSAGDAGGETLAGKVRSALRGGVSAVMAREKNLSTRALRDFAIRAREATERHGALLIINDCVEAALDVGADGVHLGWRSVSVERARSLLGPSRLIGVSTHTAEEARAACQAGADYVTFGPIFPTPSKTGLVKVQGLEGLKKLARENLPIPLIGLGGIGVDNAHATIEAGAKGVALIRAILAAGDPEAAARDIIRQIDDYK